LRPKKTKNQRLKEASRAQLEPQEGEEDGDTAGVNGVDGGGEDDGEGDAEAEEGADAGTTAKVGGQCPCGSGKKWRKCCRKAGQRERFRSGGLGGKGQQQGQGQARSHQRRDDDDDREVALTQKLAAIAL